MTQFRGIRTLFVLIALLIAGICARADSLEMRDGRVINGRYLGGTQGQVRFEVNGQVQLFPVERILAITFSGDTQPRDDDSAPNKRPSGEAAQPQRPLRDEPAANDRRDDRLEVPAGTRILVRMIDSVDSAKNRVGDRFHASLEENLYAGDIVVAPKGADVYGRLAEAKEAGHISGKAELKLELTEISINGRLEPVVSGDYDVAGKSRGKNSAEKIGGGAVAGAVIGAIAGGGKGAAIGTVVGAGAGTAVQVFTHGDQVKVPSETTLEFRIEQPIRVAPPPSR